MVVKMYMLTRFEGWRGGVHPRGGICLRDKRGEANMAVAKNRTRIMMGHKVPITFCFSMEKDRFIQFLFSSYLRMTL